ncbi:MAG: hypothetical protein AAF497_22190, partial [Planctomycetota bacterium]
SPAGNYSTIRGVDTTVNSLPWMCRLIISYRRSIPGGPGDLVRLAWASHSLYRGVSQDSTLTLQRQNSVAGANFCE